MTDQPRKRITIDAPDGTTILAARHLDATEGRVQIGTTVDSATRAAISRVLDYIAEAHNSPATDIPTSTAPAAAAHPLVKGRCPACRGASLFLGSGGHVTCARLDCPGPCAADDLLHGEHHAATPRELELRQRRAWVTAGQCPMCGYSGTDGRLCEDCTTTVRQLPARERRQWRRYAPVPINAPIQGHGYTPAGLLGMATEENVTDQPIRSYPDELRERAEADTDAAAVPATRARYEQAVARVESSGPQPADTALSSGPPCLPDHGAAVHCPGCAHDEATDPVTITDPEWLRQQYAAALREHGMVHLGDQVPADEYDCCADAVLAVRDRHLQQLRQRLTLAAADLDRYEEHVVGDLNEANIGLARQAARAEQQRDQLADDLRYVLDYRGPRHNHARPGTWDDSGQPCHHCTRLEQARQHLANLTPTEA